MLRNLSICPLNLPQFIPLDFVLMENLGSYRTAGSNQTHTTTQNKRRQGVAGARTAIVRGAHKATTRTMAVHLSPMGATAYRLPQGTQLR